MLYPKKISLLIRRAGLFGVLAAVVVGGAGVSVKTGPVALPGAGGPGPGVQSHRAGLIDDILEFIDEILNPEETPDEEQGW